LITPLDINGIGQIWEDNNIVRIFNCQPA